MQTLDTDQLRTFLAVEQTRSFTRAGEVVAKTQSAVSMQIKKLEEQLGVRLFVRGKGSVAITADGERLVGYARIMLETSQKAIAAFDQSALSGTVTLGTADDYAERYLPAILRGFTEQNPLVEVSVICEDSFDLTKRLEAGELQVAVVTHNEVKRESELLRVEPLLWVTSPRHDTHRKDPVPLALGAPHCSWRRQAMEMLERKGRAHRLLYTSYSATVISSAVLSGLAISVLPESAVRPNMRVLGERDGFPALQPCEIGIIRSKRGNDPIVDALVAHIRRSLEVMAPRAMTDRPEDVPLGAMMETAGRTGAKGEKRLPKGSVLAN